jgi:hypothetical protein
MFSFKRSSIRETVTVQESQATEEHSSWDLTREKYSVSRPSAPEEDSVTVGISVRKMRAGQSSRTV